VKVHPCSHKTPGQKVVFQQQLPICSVPCPQNSGICVKLHYSKPLPRRNNPKHTNCVGFVVFHSSGYEEYYLLGYNGMWSVENQLTLQRYIPLPSSEVKNKLSKKWARKQVASRALRRWLKLPPAHYFFARFIFWPWRWRYVPPKCQLTFNGLQGNIP
jgi:hypothetical protein